MDRYVIERKYRITVTQDTFIYKYVKTNKIKQTYTLLFIHTFRSVSLNHPENRISKQNIVLFAFQTALINTARFN